MSLDSLQNLRIRRRPQYYYNLVAGAYCSIVVLFGIAHWLFFATYGRPTAMSEIAVDDAMEPDLSTVDVFPAIRHPCGARTAKISVSLLPSPAPLRLWKVPVAGEGYRVTSGPPRVLCSSRPAVLHGSPAADENAARIGCRAEMEGRTARSMDGESRVMGETCGRWRWQVTCHLGRLRSGSGRAGAGFGRNLNAPPCQSRA